MILRDPTTGKIARYNGKVVEYFEIYTDYDGNTYPCVTIGNQHWMARDLRVTHYCDGTPIPIATNDGEWNQLTAAWYNFDNAYSPDASCYGLTYGGGVVDPSQNGGHNIGCYGWRVPTWDDVSILMNYVGTYDPGSTPDWWWGAGNTLRETGYTHWNYPNKAGVDGSSPTNQYGFDAIGNGINAWGSGGGSGSVWSGIGDTAFWWTSTFRYTSGSSKHFGYYSIGNGDSFYLNSTFLHDIYSDLTGMCIRLIKDVG